MAMSSSATTKPAEQGKTTSILGGIMHEWRQWLAPGVVVTIVLATGALQRADMRALSSKVDQVNGRFDQVNIRIDQVNGRIDGVADQMNSRIDRLTEQMNARFDRINARFDRMNARFDQVYQLLLP